MRAKQIQMKHWANCEHPCPHKTTLEVFWNRAGIKNVEDETVLRIFRLETMCAMGDERARFRRCLRNPVSDQHYQLAA